MAERPRLALDLDGTLIDAERRQCELAAAALRAVGAGERFDAGRFWRLKREGANTKQALARLGVAARDREAAADHWGRHIEAEEWLVKDRLLPEAKCALRWLHERDVRVCILTARRCEERVREQSARLGLCGEGDELIVVPVAEAVRRKAEVLARLEPLGFVGDSEVDGEAAREARVPFLAVTTGQRSESFLRARGFDCVGSLLEACRRLVAGAPRATGPSGA